jgi:prepilin-type N-terminal cleavage/methylation domain-containing protein
MAGQDGILCCDRRRRWQAHDHGRQSGFTLAEVLVGIVITSILVLGLSGLWTTVNSQFLFLSMKQKAVFVLNGEMERLSALYRFTDFSNSSAFRTVTYNNATDGDDFADANNPTLAAVSQRWIFSDAAQPDGLTDMTVTTDALFDCSLNVTAVNAQFNADCAARVLLDGNGVGTDDDRNYVWIDQHRRITARLSWRIRDVSLNTSFPNATPSCWDNGAGSDCQELTLYLDFPYRYSDASTPDAEANLGRRETLVLKTIVGRR